MVSYLHLAPEKRDLLPQVKGALALFASTSPSYLILASLDLANAGMDAYRERLTSFLPTARKWKESIRAAGYQLIGDEPLKLTLDAGTYGYTGDEIAQRLKEKDVFCEFADADAVVLMVSPMQTAEELDRVRKALEAIPQRPPKEEKKMPVIRPERILSPRETVFARSEKLPLHDCDGKIYADLCVACPPAVTPIVCGEKIDKEMIAILRHYGIKACRVLTDTRTRSRNA